MKLIPHVTHVELELPEFFDLRREGEKLTLLLSSLQSGSQKLLINLDGIRVPADELSQEAVTRIEHALLHALENTRDPVEMIAVIAPAALKPVLLPYIRHLEANSYETRLFEDRDQAHHWFGA